MAALYGLLAIAIIIGLLPIWVFLFLIKKGSDPIRKWIESRPNLERFLTGKKNQR